MNTRAFLKQLRKERDRIARAIEIIEALNPIDHTAPRRKGRHMSKAARARIGRAKKAWAAKKK